MADLLAVRLAFVKASSRYELVTDSTAATDNGANLIIDQAQRFLDRRNNAPNSERRFTKLLKSGQSFFTMDELISIKAVTIIDTTEDPARNDITENGFDYADFRKEYPGAISSWTTGAPCFWALVPTLFAPEFTFAESLTNGTFAADTDWTHTGNWAIASGVLSGTTDSGNDTQAFAAQVSGEELVIGRTYRIRFTITTISAGSVAVLCGTGKTGTSRSTAGTYTEDLVCTTDTTFGFDGTGFTGSIDNVSAIDITLQPDFIESAPSDILDTLTELPASTNSRLSGMLVYPPPNSEQTVEVLGRFFTRAMSANTDTSFWSVNHDDLLVDVAVYLAEKAFGSRDLAEQLLVRVERGEADVDKSAVELELSIAGTELEA